MIIKSTLLAIILVLSFAFTSCLKNFDVSRLIDDPIAYEAPEVVAWEDKAVAPETMDMYKGSYIDISPAFGERLRIKGIDFVIQQIMEASKDPGRIVDISPSRRGYKNTLKIYNAYDELIGTFELDSDFMLYARADKDSPLFLVPEYAYYTIEYLLLQKGSSLVEPMKNWERIEQLGDERAQYKIETLELRFEHDVKTILVQKYGLSEAYFLNYKIYTTAEYVSNNEVTVRVYALVAYAGYSFEAGEKCELHAQEDDKDKEAVFITDPQKADDCEACEDDFFTYDYHIETAAKLVYTFVDAKYFRLTSYSEPAAYNEEFPSTLESRIREIFPFEYMEDVMAALDDTTELRLDIHRQALNYLRMSGQGDFSIDD